MANRPCCACKEELGAQVAALSENAVRVIEAEHPELDLGDSVATDPEGNRRWAMCVDCARKYVPQGSS